MRTGETGDSNSHLRFAYARDLLGFLEQSEECCRCSTNHRQALLQLGMVGVWFSPFKAHALAAILDKYLIKVLKMFVSDANLLPKKKTLAHSRQQKRINSGRLHPE